MNTQKLPRAFVWKLMERFGVLGIQFLIQLFLARLLDPEHYGMLGIMVVFTNLANVFVQAGFGNALIQNKDVTEEDFSSVFWLCTVIAAAAYLVIFAAAPAIGAFYAMPEIVCPLRVIALILLPGALNGVQLAKVSREMDFHKVFRANICGVIISGIIGICAAFLGAGIWALVIQNMLSVSVNCIVMRTVTKLKLHFVCNWTRARTLFSYGWKLMVSGLIDTLYQDVRSLIIGKKFDSGVLGSYNRGKQFPQFLNNGINGAVQSVMLPALSAIQEDTQKAKQLMRDTMTISAFAVFPIMAGLAGVAEPMVRLLLTEKWLPCVPYLQIYCFTYAFYPMHTCNLQAINAMGRSDIFLRLEILKKAIGLGFLAVTVIFFDSPIAIAVTGTVTAVISSVINAWPNKKLIGYAYTEQMKDVVPYAVMTGIMLFCVRLAGKLPVEDVVLLLLQIAVGVISYGVMAVVAKPRALGVLMDMFRAARKTGIPE